jgi:hypothetical protein
MVLMAMARGVRAVGSPGFRLFAAALRACLDKQPQAERSEGWAQTLAGLGDWLTHSEVRDCILHGLLYYHQVLSRGMACGRRRLHVVGNNLASHLADLGRAGDDKGALRVCNRIHALSITAVLWGERPPEDEQVVAKGLLSALGAPGSPAADAATPVKALLHMANIAGGWQYLHPAVVGASLDHDVRWLMVLEATAGAVGTRLYPREDYPRIAAAFFNAGISVLRLGRVEWADARMGLNALGLLWSLRIAEGDAMLALADYNGLDCAVNLYGAAAQVAGLGEPTMATLRQLASVLAPMEETLPSQKQIEYERLRGSWRELRLRPGAAGPANPKALWTAVSELVRVCFPKSGETIVGDDVGRSAEATATEVASLLRGILGEQLYQQNLEGLLELASKVVALSADTGEAWLRLYGDLAPRENDPLGRGPLVEAGIVGPDEWRRLAETSTTPVDSLGDFLARSENLSWLGGP